MEVNRAAILQYLLNISTTKLVDRLELFFECYSRARNYQKSSSLSTNLVVLIFNKYCNIAALLTSIFITNDFYLNINTYSSLW
ncbi:hypothetical protein Avbf_07838 [Armadillidium vulgare]|nr:hypothetical protein Avbf_07838 [Armadillidium vulgare]